MSRSICVYLEFLTDAYRARIEEAARSCGFSVHFFDESQFEEARACLQDAEILYAHSPELLREAPATLKWYCCAYAGVDPYCKNDGIFRNPDCILTNSNVYGVTIAEHVVMVTLMLLRRMPEYEQIVDQRGWTHSLNIRSIRGGDFTILGTGDIGSHVAKNLKALGANRVTGLCRSGRSSDSAWDEVLPIQELDSVLPRTPFLIMALPSTPETIGILTRERIALLPKDAFVVNVGRGTAVDQDALMEALNRGDLAGAALDVMQPEPLPKDHPLWETKNLILTPHVSGNMSLGYTRDANVAAFCADLARYAAGEPLKGLVHRNLGY